MKPIVISKVEDTKSKILVSLFNNQRPLRLSEISKSTKMSLKLVDYHLKGLMEKELVFCDDDNSTKTYRLADSYYDDTFMETLEEYFTPIAETFAKLNPDIKTQDGVIENLKASMELFCDSNKTKNSKEIIVDDLIDEDIEQRGLLLVKNAKYPCLICGKEIEGTIRIYKEGHWVSKQFCSPECKIAGISGENSSSWKGGVSFGDYCKKFNNEFKTRCRAFFENKCVVCGITTEQHKRKMCVHHVNYNKDTCCDENVKQLFVTLCAKHHGLTNHSREYWNGLFTKLIEEKYNGKCFYTKEEWKKISHPTIR